MVGLFLYWQHYLERIHGTPDFPYYYLLTPPPLMKLSIWTRANGRVAAMMMIVFIDWSAFSSWSFWVHVRLFLMLFRLSLAIEILCISSISRTTCATM